ncbi:MAG: hypothetical protein HYX80_10430 [Chloroflexi bacterium]|nr:hypothetical protein [Chloroflexota bacterium]
MSTPAAIAQDALNLLVSRSRSVRLSAEALLAKDYPSEVPRNLIRCVVCATNRIDAEVSEMSFRLKAKPEYSEVTLKEAKLRHTFLTYLQTVILSLVDGAETGKAPAEWIWPIQRMVEELFPGCQILVRSVHELNYFFAPLGAMIQKKFASLGMDDILKDNGLLEEIWMLGTSSFPPSGILTHCLIAHEIGHGIYETRKLGDQILRSVKIDDRAASNIVDLIASQMVEESSSQETGPRITGTRLDTHIDRSWLELSVNARLKEILSCWAEEFACDVIGLRILGPAFLLSQLYFLFPLASIDVGDVEHPTPRMRLRLSINALLGTEEGLGYRIVKSLDIQSVLQNWQKTIMSSEPKANDPYFDEAYKMLRPSLREILKLCKKETKTLAYSPDRLDKDVPKLLTRIGDGIPPNELWDEKSQCFQPAYMASILNAGWLAFVAPELPMPFRSVTKQEAEGRLLSLVEKAMEYSELARLSQKK